LEPLPETEEALNEYLEEGDADLRAVLLELGHQVVSLVPSCVGLSLGLVRDGLTFTLVATSQEVAAIDAAQYLDGGPCVDVATGAAALDLEIPEVLDEGRWSAFALTSAAHGVKSTLSLPLVRQGQLLGGINLYAAEPFAFHGKHAALAAALGASAEGAVVDADLQFTSRSRAVQAPATLAELRTIDVAVAYLAARDRTDVDTARARLEECATRAGATLVQAARMTTYLIAKDHEDRPAQ
jgi:GAF domain-containing protein